MRLYNHLSTDARPATLFLLVLLWASVLGVGCAVGSSELAIGASKESIAQGYITELQDMDTDGYAEGSSSGMSVDTAALILVGILAIIAYGVYRKNAPREKKAEAIRLQRAAAEAEAARDEAAQEAMHQEKHEMQTQLAQQEHESAERLALEANLDPMLLTWSGFECSLTIGDVDAAIAAREAEGEQANDDDEPSPEDAAAQAELDGTAALQALRAPVEQARKALEAKSAAAARTAAAAAGPDVHPETTGGIS